MIIKNKINKSYFTIKKIMLIIGIIVVIFILLFYHLINMWSSNQNKENKKNVDITTLYGEKENYFWEGEKYYFSFANDNTCNIYITHGYVEGQLDRFYYTNNCEYRAENGKLDIYYKYNKINSSFEEEYVEESITALYYIKDNILYIKELSADNVPTDYLEYNKVEEKGHIGKPNIAKEIIDKIWIYDKNNSDTVGPSYLEFYEDGTLDLAGWLTTMRVDENRKLYQYYETEYKTATRVKYNANSNNIEIPATYIENEIDVYPRETYVEQPNGNLYIVYNYEIRDDLLCLDHKDSINLTICYKSGNIDDIQNLTYKRYY